MARPYATHDREVWVMSGDISGKYVEKLLRNISAVTEHAIGLILEVDDDDDRIPW
jgi:hypothetical protein